MSKDIERKRGQIGPPHDPVNLMHQIFEDASEFVGPAQDVLLSWLIKLPHDISPALAAEAVLDTTIRDCTDIFSDESRKLTELLLQVKDHGDINILTKHEKRRRGGRSARLSME